MQKNKKSNIKKNKTQRPNPWNASSRSSMSRWALRRSMSFSRISAWSSLHYYCHDFIFFQVLEFCHPSYRFLLALRLSRNLASSLRMTFSCISAAICCLSKVSVGRVASAYSTAWWKHTNVLGLLPWKRRLKMPTRFVSPWGEGKKFLGDTMQDLQPKRERWSEKYTHGPLASNWRSSSISLSAMLKRFRCFLINMSGQSLLNSKQSRIIIRKRTQYVRHGLLKTNQLSWILLFLELLLAPRPLSLVSFWLVWRQQLDSQGQHSSAKNHSWEPRLLEKRIRESNSFTVVLWSAAVVLEELVSPCGWENTLSRIFRKMMSKCGCAASLTLELSTILNICSWSKSCQRCQPLILAKKKVWQACDLQTACQPRMELRQGWLSASNA